MNEGLVVDVVVIGGGPAGLSAALVLGRARRSVVVVDEEQPRNRVTHKTGGFLTRDGATPSELRAIAREQIAAYPSVQFLKDRVTAVAGENGAFRIETERGITISARKLLFATGMKDVLPAIEGLEQVYGKSAFVCPFCDGWELRDRPLVLIAKGDRAYHMAKLLRGWTANVSICTNGPAELPEEVRTELIQHDLPLYEDPIARIDSEHGHVRAIQLEGGMRVPCGGIFFAPVLVQGTMLPEQLGCQMTPGGAMRMGKAGETSIPGVYVAGDAGREGPHQLINAAADGSIAGAWITSVLLDEEWRNKR